MTPVAVVILVLIIALIIVLLISVMAMQELSASKLREQATKVLLDSAISVSAASLAVASAENARLVTNIANLKAEIEILEKDLELHKTPAAVRTRLRELLSPPEAGADEDITPVGGMPEKSPTS